MSDSTAPVKIGALIWNQYTDWPAMLAVGQRVDELGYDSLWTWDHLARGLRQAHRQVAM